MLVAIYCDGHYIEYPTFPNCLGPLFVAFGPGTARGEQERLNWPTHYKRSKFIVVFSS